MTEQSTAITQAPPESAPAATAAPTGQVPVGIATQAGYGVAIAGLIGAVVAYVTGDHSQAQLGSIVSGSIAVISLLVTQIGRYVQANTQIKADRGLLDAYQEAAGAVHVIERADPQAPYQLAALVQAVVDERLKGLPTVPREVVGDLEHDLLPAEQEEASTVQSEVVGDVKQDLLPSEQEEAAVQPPPGALDGVATDSTALGSGSVGSARTGGA